MIIKNNKIKIDSSNVVINNGFSGMTVTTSNTADERAKRESFSSSGSSSGHSYFTNSNSAQELNSPEELHAKLEDIHNRSRQFEDMLNGSFMDKVVKEKINITNSQVTINNQVNNSPTIATTKNVTAVSSKISDVDLLHRQLRSQFRNLSFNSNQVITDLCHCITENQIGLQFGQIQDVKDRVAIIRDLEKKCFQVQAYFFKEREQSKGSIEKLLVINKLFSKKLEEYTLVIESNKEFAESISPTKNEDELLNDEINALQAEMELMTMTDAEEKREEIQSVPETQVTGEILQPSEASQVHDSNSFAYGSISYIASYLNPFNYSYFKK